MESAKLTSLQTISSPVACAKCLLELSRSCRVCVLCVLCALCAWCVLRAGRRSPLGTTFRSRPAHRTPSTTSARSRSSEFLLQVEMRLPHTHITYVASALSKSTERRKWAPSAHRQRGSWPVECAIFVERSSLHAFLSLLDVFPHELRTAFVLFLYCSW